MTRSAIPLIEHAGPGPSWDARGAKLSSLGIRVWPRGQARGICVVKSEVEQFALSSVDQGLVIAKAKGAFPDAPRFHEGL